MLAKSSVLDGASLAWLKAVVENIGKNVASFSHVPSSTYRIQFSRRFRFEDARRILPYLRELGVSHIYSSPYLQAHPGSMHGYDISDHSSINREIGTQEEYDAFVREIGRLGLKQILDIVPNHMGIGGNDNHWWQDVLENGPSSLYAGFFDIDWDPLKDGLQGKVLLPILGDVYGKVLERGDIRLVFEQGSFFIACPGRKLPLAPGSAVRILSLGLDRLAERLGGDNPHLLELQSIITALGHLPPRTEKSIEKVLELNREKEIIKRRLSHLCGVSGEIRNFIEENVSFFCGVPGDPKSFDPLEELLSEQAYRLAFWRVAAEEINYRRFFDINDLAALRMEHDFAFQSVHKLIFQLVARGEVHGLRVDHPDGLYDSLAYFERLQKHCLLEMCRQHGARHGAINEDALEKAVFSVYDSELTRPPKASLRQSFYIVAEKILTGRERLRRKWPIDGSTGYDFLNILNGVFVDQSNAGRFDEIYSRFIGSRMRYADVVYESKKLIMETAMASEVNVLGHLLDEISENNRWSRDFTLRNLTHVLREIIACFPIYRTYIDGRGKIEDWDRACVETAVAEAKRRNPAIDASIFDFVRDTLLLVSFEGDDETVRNKRLHFCMKFQQVTSPVMAKGVEDTAFYIYNRLISLNDVGGVPDRFGVGVGTFHGSNEERNQWWPMSMLATSTHDAKRSEDVRARINVLSEIPKEWQGAITRWSRLNAARKAMLGGQPVPDLNEEYLFYQTLVGAWPLEVPGRGYEEFVERIVAYMLKAVKEAKVNTSWINPDTSYDKALASFIEAVLEDRKGNHFLKAFRPFQERVSHYGFWNSLSQVLLKIASPGVPDIYQGAEIWDFSLVDPDNRRPVDFAARSNMLNNFVGQVGREPRSDLTSFCREISLAKSDGRIRMFLYYKGLNFFREKRGLFVGGDYLPLEESGRRKGHVVAFARRRGSECFIAVAPRFFTGLIASPKDLPFGKRVWGDTRLVLPPEIGASRYRNVFTGEVLTPESKDGKPALFLADIFANFPVALLEQVNSALQDVRA